MIAPDKKERKSSNSYLKKRLIRMWPLYLGLLPSICVVFIFSYVPMFGNIIAFMDYNLFNGWMGLNSPFVGLANFSFVKDPFFWELAWRTFWYSINGLVFGFPASFILALMINEIYRYRFKRIVQTISYVPHFVSWITIASLIYIFTSVDESGIFNYLKVFLFGGERIVFMQDAGNFLPILILSGIWKGVGWGTIVYLAAIAGIDVAMYEAAQIDGASRFQQMKYITLPSIVPTTCILLIFSIGGLFSSNFEQIYALQNDIIRNATNTINVYTYYKGLVEGQYSLSTAVGLFQGLIAFILIRGSNYISKRVADVGFF